MLNSVYTKIFYNLQRWKAVYTLLLIFVPTLLIAQKGINNPQAQQLLNKSNKSQFFIENKGQWPKQVKFLARLGGMNCWITDSGVVYDYYRIDRNYSPDSIMMLLPHEKDEFEQHHTSCKGQVVRMDYEEINLNAEKQGTDKREAYYNYFIGNDSTKWASFVGLYGEVQVKDAYPGIDIRYYFDSGQIRYNYLVNPGADISQISFRITGANALAVNESGELIIQTSLGEVKHGKLYAYQQNGNNKIEVSCRFERNDDGNFGVIALGYEKGLALVIDPLVWSTFIGGTISDYAGSIFIDNNKNVYISGYTHSSDFPTTTGSYDMTNNGGGDIFISLLNSSASSLIYSTFIGGSNFEYPCNLEIDAIGDIYTAGYTDSYNFPTTNGSFDQKFNDSGTYYIYDLFVVKLNPTGTKLIYSTYIGGSGEDEASDMRIDSFGNAYISGITSSPYFPTTKGSYRQTKNGSNGRFDCFITKLNQTGTALVYSTFIGGTDDDYCYAMLIDKNNCIYITGNTGSVDYPTTAGTYDQIIDGYDDAYITKLNSTGSALIFSTFIGGQSTETGYAIILDRLQNIYLAGRTGSSDFPTTIGAFDRSIDSFSDVFVSKLNSSASQLISSTFIGGNYGECPSSIDSDGNGNIFITGFTESTNYPVTSDAYNKNYGGGTEDVFLTKFNSDLSMLMYSTYIGGIMQEESGDIFVDTNGIIYLTGSTSSINFPTTSGVYDQSYNQYSDAFIMKLFIFSQAYNINFRNINCSQMDISWLKGGGKKRVVFMKLGSSGQPRIANNIVYNANNVFGLGSYEGNGWYCVYNDTGTTVTVSGLNPDTIYRIMVLEYIVSKGNEIYNTDTSVNNPVNQRSGKPPKALFTFNDSIQCQKGNKFNFINNSTATSGTISFHWLFGDGNSSNIKNPIHSFSLSGNYTIRLIASTGLNCTDSASKTIYVLPSPTASFSINDSTQCFAGNNFVFTNNSSVISGSISSNWNFGDGNSSSSTNPSYNYTYADTFSVKLIVVSDTGCKDSVIRNAIVAPAPKADFIAYDSSQCLERNNFLFSNKSTSANGSFSCLWNFGDSVTSTLLNPMHKYRYADTFTVALIVSDTFGCKDTMSKHTLVHVHPEPLANFLVNDSSQCLNGNVFVLSNSSTIKSGAFTQKWDFADGFDTVSFNAIHSYSLAGSYLIKLLIFSDRACKDSILKKVYVRPMPKAGFSINTNPQNLAGNNFVFTSTSVIPSGNLKYHWNFGDGDTSSASNPMHNFTAAGSYKVIIIATSDFGCSDTFTDSVFVLKNPGIVISFTTKNACVGQEVLFKNNSTVNAPDSFLNFSWNFGDGNLTIVRYDPKHIYSSAGTYIITLGVLTAFGYKDSLIDTLEIYPSPAVDITAIPDTIAIPGRPVTLIAYGLYDQLLWSDNSTGSSIIVTIEGKYWVTASFNNGCKNSDTIELTKGEIREIEVMNVITPNGDGINDKLVIKNIDQIKPCKLSIYNRWGDELFSSNNYQNNWDGTYKGKSLPEGTYYYVLETKDGKVSKGPVNVVK